MVWIRRIWAAPPINKKTVFPHLTKSSLERDYVAGVELFLLHKPAPPFGHHVALAAVPVGVPKPPRLPVPVLEIQQKPFLVAGRIQREVLLGMLFRDDEAVELPYVARRHDFVEHVLPLDGDWVFFSLSTTIFVVFLGGRVHKLELRVGAAAAVVPAAASADSGRRDQSGYAGGFVVVRRR